MKASKILRRKIEKEISDSLNVLLSAHQPAVVKKISKSIKEHSSDLAKKFVKASKVIEKVKEKAEKKEGSKKKKIPAAKAAATKKTVSVRKPGSSEKVVARPVARNSKRSRAGRRKR